MTSAYADNGERFDYTYEPSTGKLLTATVSDGTTSKTTTYNYSDHTNGKDANLIESVVLPTATVTYDYDGFYRTSYDVEVNSTDILTTDYTFVAGSAAGSTTTLVESMTNAGSGWSDTLSYTYDKKGNIETISENGTQKAKYYYDALNQLIREDNAWLNKTIAYTYDKGGNILSVSEYAYTTASDISSLTATSTNTYTYGDANWKDKLTAYNGNAITYDAIGNPLSYYDGKTFTWQNGRQLASVSGTGLTASYKYNADGIRTSKTVNGVTTTYLLEGNNIIKETNGTDTLWYYYDAVGSLTGFELNGTPYFYVKNLQGDIIAITNASGTVVAEYTFDSWGKLISTTGSLASTVGVKNPFRYRGYYYDTEIGLYYLNSRYYDPITKRFVNADNQLSSIIKELRQNLYAYCVNCAIDKKDSMGQKPEDVFVTMDEAAIDAAMFLGELSFGSISDFHGNYQLDIFYEYCVSIEKVKIDGVIKYTYRTETLGTSYRTDTIYSEDIVFTQNTVAIVHTHPFNITNQGRYTLPDEFSPGDRTVTRKHDDVVYAYSASGKLRKCSFIYNDGYMYLEEDVKQNVLKPHWYYSITRSLFK